MIVSVGEVTGLDDGQFHPGEGPVNVWRTLLFPQQLLQLRVEGFGPDFVAFFAQMGRVW
jgi:hypothetical protein